MYYLTQYGGIMDSDEMHESTKNHCFFVRIQPSEGLCKAYFNSQKHCELHLYFKSFPADC
jgi:hypothetical protein